MERLMGDVTVNSINIAETTQEQVWFKPIIGAYELCFNFSLKGSPEREGKHRWAEISTARVQIKAHNGKEHDFGLAHLETPISIKTHPEHPIIKQVTFYLKLTDTQVSQLEDIRDGHDLNFMLMIKGVGGDGEYTNVVHDNWKVEMPRSKWIELLKQVGYMDIMLIEVPMLPKGKIAEDWIDIRHDLKEAQRHFLNREYPACVAKCRSVIQEAGHKNFGKQNWANPHLDKIGKKNKNTDTDRKDMTKDEREGAIWAALRHYTHQSNHSKSEGGERMYSRSDAKLILVLTAAFISK